VSGPAGRPESRKRVWVWDPGGSGSEVVAASEKITPISDEELIAGIQSGSEASFGVFYDRYFPRVYHFVNQRLRNHADSEEVVQEVFINVVSSIGSFRGESALSSWIYGVTRRTIARRFKRKRHPTVALVDSNPQDPRLGAGPTPLQSYECAERLDMMVAAAQDQLSDEQRELFRLHHLENRPIKEIADRLNKTENSIKSNLYRTRKILLTE
jgi:RNA polymerase sigma-70 factor (ECF subfamily)